MIFNANAHSSSVRLLAAFFPLLSGIVLFSATDMNIKLQPVSVEDAASVTGVQLVNRTGVQLLIGYNARLILEGASGGGPTLELKLGSLPGSVWEARPLDTGMVAAVYTQPGSAINWVVSRTSGAPDEKRLHNETFALYFEPHYVKGQAEDPPVTAIQHGESKGQVVLFPNDNSTTTPQTIGEPAKFLTDARLLQDSTGYWLFTLVRVPGEGGSAGPRKTRSGDRMAGILHATRLGKDLRPTGSSIRILGTQAVYEFDVEPMPSNEVSILATTPAGAVYVRATLTNSPLPADAWKETRFERPLSSPSLLVREGIEHVAAVENMKTPDALVLRGQIQ